MTYSVHDEDGFEPVYDEDEVITIRKGDLRALLDLATSSMDFGSGFWDNEQVEIARKVAEVLGVDPLFVTPSNFTCQYKGEHQWGEWFSRSYRSNPDDYIWFKPGFPTAQPAGSIPLFSEQIQVAWRIPHPERVVMMRVCRICYHTEEEA